MDIETARTELLRALDGIMQGGPHLHAAHKVLGDRGVEALGITSHAGLFLDEIVRIAADAPRTAGRRAFAVLLVHALGVRGLLPARGRTAGDIQLFLERALLNPLRRANYPFDGTF